MKRTGVLIVGHGSRDLGSNAEFEELVSRFRARRPDLRVSLGYVELARPTLSEALAALAAEADEVLAVPLFLFAAGHVKNDIPLALEAARREFPGVRFSAARALGVHPTLIDVAADRMLAVVDSGVEPSRTAVVLVGRGASDPDANGDFFKVARLLGEGRGMAWVAPAFIGITRPLFEEAVEVVAGTRPAAIVVVPYFLFAGRLIDKLAGQVTAFAERYPWIKIRLAGHLGPDERLLTLMDERIAEARNGMAPLPCDTCQYRAPVSGVVGQVGGLRAMLWSLRHSFTHTQAMPHEHAHAPLIKHVLICGNIDCADGGSIGVLAAVRRLVKEAGRDRDIKVTRTSCMGRCGEGPTVAVYPDGIWYRNVRENDAEELVREHLLADRLVSRLVDNIMQ
jgi:sirohydrochlorin cobaltochelatase